MEVLFRNKAAKEFIVKSKDGRIWLTRRVKNKKSSRNKKHTVKYMPIAELPDETRRVYLEKFYK